MMNIGFFYSNYEYPPTSGSGVHCYHLVKHLTELGHRVNTYYYGGPNPAIRHFRGRELFTFLRDIDVLYIRIDVRYRMELFTLLKLLAGQAKPVVWEVNSPPQELFLEKPTERVSGRAERRRRALARMADAAIVVSAPLSDYARGTLGIRNVHVIPNGSDPENFSPLKRNATLYAKPFNAVWVGSTRFPWHAIETILEAAAIVEMTDPEIGFVLVGDTSFLPSALPSNVTCVGEIPHNEVPKYLASADVGLLLYRGFDRVPVGFYFSPLKLYDYLASGLSVIGNNIGQVAEVVQHGRNGLLCDGSPESLVELLHQLRSQPDLRARMGAAARKTVEDFYNWRRVAEQTDHVLRQVVQAGRRRVSTPLNPSTTMAQRSEADE